MKRDRKTPIPAPKGPPKYTPKPVRAKVHPIEQDFFADPFDPRFQEGESLTDQRLSPLGMLVQTFGYLRSRLLDVCPDAVEFIERTVTSTQEE